DELWRLRRFGAAGKLVSEQMASGRTRRPVTVNVDVPATGWAALDCFSKPDRLSEAKKHMEAWWKQMTAHRHGQAAAPGYRQPREAWIVWTDTPSAPGSNNQQSYRTVLDLCGFSTRPVSLGQFVQTPRDKTTLLVVTGEVAPLLTEDQQKK